TTTTTPTNHAAPQALIDESMMTGEAVLIEKHPGDHLLSGTIVKGGTLSMRAEAVGQKTVLANMIRMVQEAQGSKAPVQHVVDRIALVFVPAVVGLSVLTFALWLLIGGMQMLPQAFLSAVSVLVIACPCAMGLATPTALMVGIGKAAERGILIKDATALEELCRIDAMVVDKTGTITENTDHTERLKPHAAEAIATLRGQGIDLFLMSGDKEERVSHWAQEAGIANYKSEVLPQDKEDLVRQLQKEAHHVAMVGDGINDSQALAAANVSIAMGRGTDVAMDVAQVTLMSDDLRRIGDAIRLSRQTVSAIRQNLFWAFIYNMVCIPLAAGLPYLFGYQWQITPMLASALMAFSSVSVVLNSLRLKLKD
ncbi:MAG: HAD-IC family P-type ATPase, partial [Prevotella sp.]|nr:HAD-IC family P-type ATPase [Prevotella sp.]